MGSVEEPTQPEGEAPKTTEERIALLEEKVTALLGNSQLTMGLLKALGEMTEGVQLKYRQMPGGGLQFYWSSADRKRIILPS